MSISYLRGQPILLICLPIKGSIKIHYEVPSQSSQVQSVCVKMINFPHVCKSSQILSFCYEALSRGLTKLHLTWLIDSNR